MSGNKIYHSISSSEDEQEDYKGIEIEEEKPPDGAVKPKILKDILSKVKGVKHDFGDIAGSSILYSNEITEDDEIWLIQTPKDLNPESFGEGNFKFKDSSRMTLKARKKKRHFNVHAIKSTDEKMNCVLPMKKTQSFHMNIYPVTGRIILQEDLQVSCKDETSSKHISNSSIVLDSMNNLVDSQTSDSESTVPLKKKKRKSVKQETLQINQ